MTSAVAVMFSSEALKSECESKWQKLTRDDGSEAFLFENGTRCDATEVENNNKKKKKKKKKETIQWRVQWQWCFRQKLWKVNVMLSDVLATVWPRSVGLLALVYWKWSESFCYSPLGGASVVINDKYVASLKTASMYEGQSKSSWTLLIVLASFEWF